MRNTLALEQQNPRTFNEQTCNIWPCSLSKVKPQLPTDSVYLKIADYYDWTAYVDYYFFYRNNNWVCSPRHARDVNPKDNARNNSAYEYNEKSGSETDGIMGFGKGL